MAARLMGLAKKEMMKRLNAETVVQSDDRMQQDTRNNVLPLRKHDHSRHIIRFNSIIYCDDNTRKAIHKHQTHEFTFSTGFDVVVKGKSEPIKCYSVQDVGKRSRKKIKRNNKVSSVRGRNAQRRYQHYQGNNNTGDVTNLPAVFVGRDAQLDMANMVLSSRPTISTLIYFRGPKGLGKSTMLARVCEMANVLNYTVASALPNIIDLGDGDNSIAYSTVCCSHNVTIVFYDFFHILNECNELVSFLCICNAKNL